MKFIIILILIIYVFYKTAGFLFKFVFGSLRSDPGHFGQDRADSTKRAPDSNLNIDRVPNQKSGKKEGYEGGEYVDFEEIK